MPMPRAVADSLRLPCRSDSVLGLLVAQTLPRAPLSGLVATPISPRLPSSPTTNRSRSRITATASRVLPSTSGTRVPMVPTKASRSSLAITARPLPPRSPLPPRPALLPRLSLLPRLRARPATRPLRLLTRPLPLPLTPRLP